MSTAVSRVTLHIDTARKCAIEPSGGQISVISRASDCQFGGSREPSDFCNRLVCRKSAAESDFRPASEAPSSSCDLPSRVSGEAPCRGSAEPRHGRRVGPFQQAGLGPVYELGRPAATRPARPERMRGHQARI